MNHGISQIINNLKTANIAGKEKTTFGFSKFRKSILDKVSDLGFISNVKVTGNAPIQYIEVSLVYETDGRPKLAGFQQLSIY